MDKYTFINGGISAKYRESLDTLNRELTGPFSATEAIRVLQVSPSKANRLLAYFAERGWLSRLRRGLYTTVPLGATNPSERRNDPWVMADKIFSPCYIGGWSACEFWELTEQIFNDVVVFTTRRSRKQRVSVKNINYLIKTVSQAKLFGMKTVWKEEIKVSISDPSRTIIDILNDPAIGGGIRNIADVLKEYFNSNHRSDIRLIEYLSLMKNRAINKRLGFLIETLKIDAKELTNYCKSNISAGYSKLDPTIEAKGNYVRRWNLMINVSLTNEELK